MLRAHAPGGMFREYARGACSGACLGGMLWGHALGAYSRRILQGMFRGLLSHKVGNEEMSNVCSLCLTQIPFLVLGDPLGAQLTWWGQRLEGYHASLHH